MENSTAAPKLMTTIIRQLLFSLRGWSALITWTILFLAFTCALYSVTEIFDPNPQDIFSSSAPLYGALALFDKFPDRLFYATSVAGILLVFYIYKLSDSMWIDVPGQEIWITSNSFLAKSTDPRKPLKDHHTGFTFLFPGEKVLRKISLVREKLDICSSSKDSKGGKRTNATSIDGAAIMWEWSAIAYPDPKNIITYSLHDSGTIANMITAEINQVLSDVIAKNQEEWIMANKGTMSTQVSQTYGGERTKSSTEIKYGVIILDPVLSLVDITDEMRKARSDIAQLKDESAEAQDIVDKSKDAGGNPTISFREALDLVANKRGNVDITRSIVEIKGLENAKQVMLGMHDMAGVTGSKNKKKQRNNP